MKEDKIIMVGNYDYLTGVFKDEDGNIIHELTTETGEVCKLTIKIDDEFVSRGNLADILWHGYLRYCDELREEIQRCGRVEYISDKCTLALYYHYLVLGFDNETAMEKAKEVEE